MLRVSIRSKDKSRRYEQVLCGEVTFYSEQCMLEDIESDFESMEVEGLEIIGHPSPTVSLLVDISTLCNIKTL